MAKELSEAKGLSTLLVAQNDAYKGFLPEAVTPLLQEVQKQFSFTHIIAGASAYGKVRQLASVCLINSRGSLLFTVQCGCDDLRYSLHMPTGAVATVSSPAQCSPNIRHHCSKVREHIY